MLSLLYETLRLELNLLDVPLLVITLLVLSLFAMPELMLRPEPNADLGRP